MSEKELYKIECYIPSDEDVVVSNLYKLIKLGSKEPKYIFICLTRSGGYGTALDNFGYSSETEALVSVLKNGLHNSETEFSKIDYFTFNEAVDKMREFTEKLSQLIKEAQK